MDDTSNTPRLDLGRKIERNITVGPMKKIDPSAGTSYGWRQGARKRKKPGPPATKPKLPTRRCKAHSSRTGKPCKKAPIEGGAVCTVHGGSAPQVKKAAKERIAAMVDPALDTLHYHTQPKRREKEPAVSLSAAKDILDRAGLKSPDRIQHEFIRVEPEDLDLFTDAELADIRRVSDMMFDRIAQRRGGEQPSGG